MQGKITTDGMNQDEMNAQQKLLNWCQENLKGYDSIRVKDFSTSWRDGKALLAILNRHRPDKISFIDSYLRSNLENLKIAFDFAETELGVTKLLDPEDVDTDHPDEKSIMTYISMLYNVIPNVPMHPSDIKLESHKKNLMDEYSVICKSLMRWLRDSISTMDNRTVPHSLIEIKSLLNDIRTFRLEEYATKLKEKKRLANLYNEMISLPDSDSLNLDNELNSIEKVWLKFDSYIQLRENLLEKTYKKYENLQVVIQRIEKSYENCDKILNSIENELKQPSNQNMMNGHLKSFNERLNDQLSRCDQEIRKLFIECQNLNDEEHNEAEFYYRRAEQIQNRSVDLKTKLNNLQPNYKNSVNIEIEVENSDFRSKISFLEKQKIILQDSNFPSEYNQIDKDILKIEQIQMDLNTFRDSYLKDNQTQDDTSKYYLNELEILYNLTYNLSNQRLKSLNQLKDFVKQINDEMFYLDQKEEVEINRDWSSPSKLDSSSLKQYKKNLDYELERRLKINIHPLKVLGQALINDKHPAANHIRTYIETLSEHFNWINQLSFLLSNHLYHLTDYESFKSEYNKLSDRIEQFRHNLTNVISNSTHKNYSETIEKLDKMLSELSGFKSKLESLSNKSKSITPFHLRKQKLKSPYNKCKCLINYKRSQFNIRQNEECIIEDNTQKTKWKVLKPGTNQSSFVPSVCFLLPPPDEESQDLIQQLKIRIENLTNQVLNYKIKFKKDRLFNLMNQIKFCEFDDYEERRKLRDSDKNFDLMLNSIKFEIEEMINSVDLKTGTDRNHHTSETNTDVQLLIESYDKCCQKLNDFNEKSIEKNECQKFEKQFGSDLQCLELRLKYLYEKFEQIEKLEIKSVNRSDFIDKVIAQYQVSFFFLI
ncbi:unnamed protein product [Brachionus calyciflorus]|uniref:Calponin-homology (CH) domain-containing protein n=1 Tax=Brachionus calyciflorus TaxID=104777 RepID=A0A813M7B3_9BILA|nr:unnamed protein product [Brachionus calyciflorus]